MRAYLTGTEEAKSGCFTGKLDNIPLTKIPRGMTPVP